MSIWAWAIIGLAIFASGGALVHRYDVGQFAIKENARLEAAQLREKAARLTANSAAVTHEGERTIIETKFQTITERINVEVEKPVYRNVCLAADGLQQLADAAASTGYTREPSNPMPPASASK